MNSRERFLAAIRREPVDRVPLYLRLWSMHNGTDNIPFKWHDQVSRAENLLKLGVDDTLLLEPPLGYTEEYHADLAQRVTATVTQLPPVEQETYPRLRKVYDTPDGPLTITVKTGKDWIHGSDIMLFSDFNLPRQTEPIIKDINDVKRLRHLLARPTPEQLEEFHLRSQIIHREAERLGVVIDGGWSALGDSAVWLCGTDNIYRWQMRRPELLEELFDVLLEWEMMRTELVLQEGIDIMVHMAWYEGTIFWTPKNFRRLIKPRLAQLVDKCHSAGVPFRYIITKDWKPIQDDLLELGIDCITGIDPVQDKIDLSDVKKQIGDKVCLMGGINAAVTLTQWRDDQIRSAIDQAIEILSPGNGFILYPVDNVFCELPWEKVELIIDQYKKHWR
jgi:uroporphyrinogen-III decarboxylase